MIDSEYLMKGMTYGELPETYIFYISETDLWKVGKTVYEVQKFFKGTDLSYDDGIHVIYVNAAVDDESDIARLMHYFKTSDPRDMSQGELSKRVSFFKHDEEGGVGEMCRVSEEIYEMGHEDGIAKGKAEGELQKAKTTALNLAEMGLSAEQISKGVEVDVEKVKEWLVQAGVEV